MSNTPRIVIAGTGGDSGKTLLSLGLIATLRRQGRAVAPFKKGPDYIDADWLGRAAGVDMARNLDAYLMPDDVLRRSFLEGAGDAEISVIEGNRGLHDGLTAAGTYSTADLAKRLGAPVLLVLPVTKVTRTAAAVVLGCQQLDLAVRIVGVVLNRVAGPRQEAVIREAIESSCGVPVIGALPRDRGATPLPDRHLGLVTPGDHPDPRLALDRAAELVAAHVDVPQVLELARAAGPVPGALGDPALEPVSLSAPTVRLAVFRDEVFSFYYPENLAALEAAGAELVEVSPLRDQVLPAVDGLYIGGGFPEVHAEVLSSNQPLAADVRAAASRGLPVYAECGGLIYLSESLRVGEQVFPLAGVLPVHIALERRPQGHGYVEALVERENPYFPVGCTLRGHEFHYTRIVDGDPDSGVLALGRGTGAVDGRDGLVLNNVWASYLHLHALGTPGWAPALVARARDYRSAAVLPSDLTARAKSRK